MIALSVAFLVSMVITLLVVHYEYLHSHVTADHDLDDVQKMHALLVSRVGGVGVMMTLAVLPATLFWRSTAIPQTTALLFASFYVFAYWKIYLNRVPRFLVIKIRAA